MNTNRKHDRESFYKYMSASTALIVLSDCTIRWSSPIEFNDPFDVPKTLLHNIQSSDMQSAIAEHLINLFRNPEIDIGHIREDVQQLTNVVRHSRPEAKDNIEAGLKEYDSGINSSAAFDELQNMWKELIPEFRILSLTAKNDSASMWYHYADKYTGVVIELSCLDELDSPWLLAKQVRYPNEKPSLFTASGWAEMILEKTGTTLYKILDAYTYTKTPDWEYEEEWRITSFKRSHETGTISDYSFHPKDIKKVYLGPLITGDQREEIISIVRRNYNDVPIYDVSFGNREFTFHLIENE